MREIEEHLSLSRPARPGRMHIAADCKDPQTRCVNEGDLTVRPLAAVHYDKDSYNGTMRDYGEPDRADPMRSLLARKLPSKEISSYAA
jgi:hypothetical protein